MFRDKFKKLWNFLSSWYRGLKFQFALVIFVASFSFGVNYLFVNSTRSEIEKTIKDAYQTRLPQSQQLGELMTVLNTYLKLSWQAAAIQKNPSERETVISKAGPVLFYAQDLIEDIKKTDLDTETKDQIAKLVSSIEKLKASADKIFTLLNQNKAESDIEAQKMMMESFVSNSQEIDSEVRAIIKSIEKVNKASEAGAGVTLVQTNKKIILSSVVSAVLLWLIGYLIAARASRKLMDIGFDVADAAIEVEDSSMKMVSAAQGVSSTTHDQAAQIEETSATLEQISAMVDSNLASTEKSLAMARQVQEFSEKTNVSITTLAKTMDDIQESNKRVQGLEYLIKTIGEKTEVIDEIVFQTRLLSFNASVEAERAGESGRAFAVVAQEVGNLAQMSGKSALEINKILKEALTEAHQVVGHNRELVQKGTQICREAVGGIAKMLSASQNIVSSSDEILMALKEQGHGIKQITESMNSFSSSIQQNSNRAQISAENSNGLNELALRLNEMVDELNLVVSGAVANLEEEFAEVHDDNYEEVA